MASTPYRAGSSYLEHRAIVDAIAAHDGDAADRAMIQHIEIIKNFFDDEHSRIFFQSREPRTVSGRSQAGRGHAYPARDGMK